MRDVARANVLALTGERPALGAYNVASGEPRTIGEMAAVLCRAAGPGAPPPVLTGRGLGDVRHVSRARSALLRKWIRRPGGLRRWHGRIRAGAASHGGGVEVGVDVALLVIAKAPLPGRVKTRLCPPCTGEQATRVAGAALLDTLATVASTPASRRVLVFDDGGDRGDRTLVSGRVGERAAWPGAGGATHGGLRGCRQPSLLVGMDTPQLTVELLLEGIGALTRPRVDAVLGPALDGGYWSAGLGASTRRCSPACR